MPQILVPLRLVLLRDQEIFDDEIIHLRPHKAAIGIVWGADDRFSTDVEGGVDQDRAPRLRLELF